MMSLGNTIARAIIDNTSKVGGDWPLDATHKVTCNVLVDGGVQVCEYFARSADEVQAMLKAHVDSNFLCVLFPAAKEVSCQAENIFVEEWDWGPTVRSVSDYL